MYLISKGWMRLSSTPDDNSNLTNMSSSSSTSSSTMPASDGELLEALFPSITTPVVCIDATGQIRYANEMGRQYFDNLGPIKEELPQLIQTAQLSGGSSMLNSVSAHLRLTPLGQNGCHGALLEWLADTGNQQLGLLQEVSQAVNSSLILEDIFDSLSDVLQKHIPFQEGVIIILDETQNGVKVMVRLFDDGTLEITGENHAFAGYDPVIDDLLTNQEPRLYQRAPKKKKSMPVSVVFPPHAKSGLAVPLINKGVTIGLITLSRHQGEGFGEYENTLLTQVSSQLAVAVENARLYWQTQTQASREFLINELTMAIRQSLNIDEILSTAVRELGKVMGVSRCYIQYFPKPILSDSLEKLDVTLASTSPDEASEADETLQSEADTVEAEAHKAETNGGLAKLAQVHEYLLPGTKPTKGTNPDFERQVFEMRQSQSMNPFILNDVKDCPPQLADVKDFTRNDIQSMAIIPILIRDELVGTMSLHQCDAHRTWVVEDIELLKAMSEHLGVALYQAQLFAELEAQKYQLETTLSELQQAQLYLIQSEKMAVLGQFVAGIAHEVNTPLGTMMGNNSTLQQCLKRIEEGDDNPNLMPTAHELLDLNELASRRIQEIVKNLRNFARLDESEMKSVDLHEGIDSTLLILKGTLRPNVEIIKEYAENLPPVECYPGLLNQVFMNLIVNAVHAITDHAGTGDTKDTDEGGTITIHTEVLAVSGNVAVSVIDTGKGIPKENMARIFDPGFTTKGVGVGTGLGLALCYRIIEKHRGKIHVESAVGQGTRFTVEVPASTKSNS